MTPAYDPVRRGFYEANAQDPHVQAILRDAIHDGLIRVAPAADGGIRVTDTTPDFLESVAADAATGQEQYRRYAEGRRQRQLSP